MPKIPVIIKIVKTIIDIFRKENKKLPFLIEMYEIIEAEIIINIDRNKNEGLSNIKYCKELGLELGVNKKIKLSNKLPFWTESKPGCSKNVKPFSSHIIK